MRGKRSAGATIKKQMDSNLLTALVTNVTAAGSTAGVAITALLLSNKRIDRVEAALDRVDARLDRLTASMDLRFDQFTALMDARLESVDARLESLTGSMHDIDKSLSIIEDRVGRS